jgi:hypothetical protein
MARRTRRAGDSIRDGFGQPFPPLPAEAAEWRPVFEAIVVYDGGDSITVPMT